jgi:hypothetical protein
MGNLGEFDATGVTPAESFEPIPPGKYRAAITESDVRETRAKNGHYAHFEWTILEGPHANRRVFQNCNIVNPNPKAAEIGQRELSAICHACGVLRIKDDTAELHNIPCIIRVKVKPAKAGFDASNEVSGVMSAQEQAPPAPAAPAAPPVQRTVVEVRRKEESAAPAPAAAGVAPWLRKK